MGGFYHLVWYPCLDRYVSWWLLLNIPAVKVYRLVYLFLDSWYLDVLHSLQQLHEPWGTAPRVTHSSLTCSTTFYLQVGFHTLPLSPYLYVYLRISVFPSRTEWVPYYLWRYWFSFITYFPLIYTCTDNQRPSYPMSEPSSPRFRVWATGVPWR